MDYECVQEMLKDVKSESENEETDEEASWKSLPEHILVKILKLLKPREILNCSEVCKRWYCISRDSQLWKAKFREDFKADKQVKLKPSKCNHPMTNIT